MSASKAETELTGELQSGLSRIISAVRKLGVCQFENWGFYLREKNSPLKKLRPQKTKDLRAQFLERGIFLLAASGKIKNETLSEIEGV